MTPDSKLWQMKKWPEEWAESPLSSYDAERIEKKQGYISFWHNGVLFQRSYRYEYVHFDCAGEEYSRRTDKRAYDYAILGESFGPDDNPFNLILSRWFSCGNLKILDKYRDKRKLSREVIRALCDCAKQYSLRLCEVYALLDGLLNPMSTSNVDSKTIRNKVLKVLYPVFPFLPNGWHAPRIKEWEYDGISVDIIGDGQQYIDRLKSLYCK